MKSFKKTPYGLFLLPIVNLCWHNNIKLVLAIILVCRTINIRVFSSDVHFRWKSILWLYKHYSAQALKETTTFYKHENSSLWTTPNPPESYFLFEELIRRPFVEKSISFDAIMTVKKWKHMRRIVIQPTYVFLGLLFYDLFPQNILR